MPFSPLAILGAWLVLFWAGRVVAQAADLGTLRVGTVAWAGFAPLHVGAAEGFWKQRGLSVEVQVFPDNQELNSALEAEKVDLALDMIGSWVGLYQAGVPLVIVGETDWSNGGDKIIVRTDFSLNRLAGQRVGVYLDQPSVLFFLHRYLQTQGIRLADVDLIELPPTTLADAFVASRFPLIVNYDPQASRAEREGMGRVVATSASFPGIIPEGFAALRAKWQALPVETQVVFWQGWIQAVAWARDPGRWPEYQIILNEATYPDDPDFSEAQLRALVSAVSLHSPTLLAERNRPQGALTQYLTDLHRFLKETGKLHREFEPAQLLAADALVTAAAVK